MVTQQVGLNEAAHIPRPGVASRMVSSASECVQRGANAVKSMLHYCRENPFMVGSAVAVLAIMILLPFTSPIAAGGALAMFGLPLLEAFLGAGLTALGGLIRVDYRLWVAENRQSDSQHANSGNTINSDH